MTHLEFLKSTVLCMEDDCFVRMRKALCNGKYIYINFNFIEIENVTNDIFAEKLFEYFESVMYRNKCNFDELLESYFAMWQSVVGARVEKVPKVKKNDPKPDVSRARKYYDKFSGMDEKKADMQRLIDFSRVMMCLYSAIIGRRYAVINDFDFSIEAIKPNIIIKSLREEQDVILGKKLPTSKFDFSKRYNADTCSLIITIIMMFTIIGLTAAEG